MIEVFLPGMLPSKWLSPNRGERREGRVPEIISDAKREMRSDVCLGLLADDSVRALQAPLDPVHVALVLRYYKRSSDGRYRPEDAGNAIYSLKAAIDGIIDAGVIIDDGYRHVALLTGRVERCSSRLEEGLLISVTEIGG